MRKRAFAKAALALLEVLSAIVLAAAVLWAVPASRDYFAERIGFVQAFVDFWQPETWVSLPEFSAYPSIWGLLLFVIVIVVLQALTVWPLVVLCRKPKAPETAEATRELEEGGDYSNLAFVDRKGNYGHVRVKGRVADPRSKYYSGLNQVQADQEFDWRHYTGVKPAVRIVLGVVLGVIALFLLVVRFGWYVSDASDSIAKIYSNSFLSGAMSDMDYLGNHLFDSLANLEVGTVGSSVVTGQEVCDFIFWILLFYAGVMVVLILVSCVAWCFRKSIGTRRAVRARARYYADVAAKTFYPIFADEAQYLCVGVRSQDELRGETLPEEGASNIEPAAVSSSPEDRNEARRISISEIGTGIDEVEAVQVNVEGNVFSDSALSYTLNEATDDLMLIDPTLLSAIAVFTERSERIQPRVEQQVEIPTIAILTPRYSQIEEVEEKQTELRPSDRTPLYWYSNAELRPSDFVPSYWYEGVILPEVQSEVEAPEPEVKSEVKPEVAVEAPVEFEGPVDYLDKDQLELYKLLANAIEPFILHPVYVEGAHPTAVAPTPWRISTEIGIFPLTSAPAVSAPDVTAPEVFSTSEIRAVSIKAPELPVERVKTRFVPASERSVAHWLLLATLEAESPVQEEVGLRPAYVSGTSVGAEELYSHRPIDVGASLVRYQRERLLSLFLEPESLTPAEVEGAETSLAQGGLEASPVALSPIYSTRPSNKTPDYWYERALLEPVYPFSFQPYEAPAVIAAPALPAEPVESRATLVQPSDQLPEHWIAGAVHEAVEEPGFNAPVPAPSEVAYASGLLASGLAGAAPRAGIGLPVVTSVTLTVQEAALEQFLEPGKAAAEAAAKGAIVPEVELVPSSRSPDYWYEIASYETARAVPFYYVRPEYLKRPSDRVPAYWYENAEKAPAFPFVFAPYQEPVRRPSDRSVDYWYAKAYDEAQSAEPFVFVPYVVPQKAQPVFVPTVSPAVLPTWHDRPSDKTPDYWYDLARETFVEIVAPALPVQPVESRLAVVASEQLPEHWIVGAVHEAAGLVAPAPVHTATVSGLVTSAYGEVSGLSGTAGYAAAQTAAQLSGVTYAAVSASEAALEQFLEPGALSPAAIEGAEVEAVGGAAQILGGEAEAVAEAPELVGIASNRSPDYWYEIAASEAAVSKPFVYVRPDYLNRPSDYEPRHWYDLAVGETRAAGRPIIAKPVRPIKPITPVKPVKPAEPAPEEPVAPKIVGPIGLAHAKSKPSAVKIQPVAARRVRFQLKTMGATYQGKLTPEEAFAKAVTNQNVVIAPVFADAGKASSKYLASRRQKEKSKALKTGYVSATVVSDLKADESRPASEEFNLPVSAFSSIREWAKAKKEFEANRKKEAETAQTAKPAIDKEKIKPISVVKPIKPVSASKPEEPVKPQPKPIAPLKPIKPINRKPVQPIKPIKPIKPIDPNKKKGE